MKILKQRDKKIDQEAKDSVPRNARALESFPITTK